MWRTIAAVAVLSLFGTDAGQAQVSPVGAVSDGPPLATGPTPAFPELGHPFRIEHFTADAYGAFPQNWDVTQAPNGLIYVANNDGVLEYDGERWRLIRTPGGSFVFSLDVDVRGRVFVGAQDGIGLLVPDSVGALRYVSLMHHVPEQHRPLGDVWGVHAIGEDVYFQSPRYLLRWDGRRMHVWETSTRFHKTFLVGDRLLVRELRVGLLEVAGDSLRLLEGGERFATLPIHFAASAPGGGVLLGTRHAGLFVHDGESLRPVPSPLEDMLRQYELYGGCRLAGGYLAFATRKGGLLIVDANYELVQVLNETNALPDLTINGLYLDAQDGLWLALNFEGLVRMESLTPLTVYDEQTGLEGVGYAMARHRERLYVGTSAGLFGLRVRPPAAPEEGGEPWWGSRFERLAGVPAPVRGLLDMGPSLLAATSDGLYEVAGPERSRILAEPIRTVARSRMHPGVVYLGTDRGLQAVRREGDVWRVLDPVDLQDKVYSITETAGGDLWVATESGWLYRLSYFDLGAPVEKYGPADGLGGSIAMAVLNGEPLFATREGVLRFVASDDPAQRGVFVPDERFTHLQPGHEDGPLLAFYVHTSDEVWMVHAQSVHVATPERGDTYGVQHPPALQGLGIPQARLYAEQEGAVWICTGEDLLRYDPQGAPEPKPVPPVLVRSVSLPLDGVQLFGGAGAGVAPLTLDPNQNDLRFEVALPYYRGEVVYQFRLEGEDAEWTPWTDTPYAVYPHLTEGRYAFQVRSQAAIGGEVAQAAFAFVVRPPWFRTVWAYALYLSLLFGLAAFAVRHRRVIEENKRARRQAEEFERERKVIHQLQEANRRLQQADRLKDAFITTTSHELRTPLTAILGYTAILKEESAADHHREFLSHIEQSGNRLLDTLNSVLELAKLQAGLMDVHPQPVEVDAEVEAAVQRHWPAADRKGLLLQLSLPDLPLPAEMDPLLLSRIMDSLLSNAIKFTDEGAVQVSVEADEEGWATITVRDTGVGIEPGFFGHLFEPFRQESSGLRRLQEGSGLGLAVAGGLVKLLRGTIAVESARGEGSTFTVRLPLG